MNAVYVRVSTVRQDHKLQLRAVIDWLKAQGLRRQDVKWYRDRGRSSAAHSRPAWDRLMDALRQGAHPRLVVWKIDRANRWSVKDHLRWRLELDRLGVELVSLTESDAGKFDGIMDVMREAIEAEGRAKWMKDHRERVRVGIKTKRKAGEPWGGARVVDPTRKGCAALTPEQWAEAGAMREAGKGLDEIGRVFGVGPDAIRKGLGRKARC